MPQALGGRVKRPKNENGGKKDGPTKKKKGGTAGQTPGGGKRGAIEKSSREKDCLCPGLEKKKGARKRGGRNKCP